LKKHSGIFTHKKINNGLQNHVHSHEMKAPDISRLITPNYFFNFIYLLTWKGHLMGAAICSQGHMTSRKCLTLSHNSRFSSYLHLVNKFSLSIQVGDCNNSQWNMNKSMSAPLNNLRNRYL